MKLIQTTILLIFMSSTAAYADNIQEGDMQEGMKLDERKQFMLEQIDRAIEAKMDFKTCVNAATDMPAIKACRQELKEKRELGQNEQRSIKEEQKSKKEENHKLEKDKSSDE